MKHVVSVLVLACSLTVNQSSFAEAKDGQAATEEKTTPSLRVLSATYTCPEAPPAENEKYALALEQQIAGIAGVEKMNSKVTASEVIIQVTLAENANYDAVLERFAAVIKQFSIADPELQQLFSLWGKGSAPDVKLEEKEKRKVEKLFTTLLPSDQYIGADKEWEVTYIDSDAEDIISVKLKEKGGSSSFIWFHILYKPGLPASYGSEAFGKYRGMGATDAHYFIKAGNVEIRAVASAEEYKKDEAIKGILNAFKLEDIETL